MDGLLLRDIRCFRGEHDLPIRPLTLLVGENSTGKSTVLGLTRLAWDLAMSTSEPNFNEEPFLFGAFDDMAHYHGGQGKRAKKLGVGLSLARAAFGEERLRVEVDLTEKQGQPCATAAKLFLGGAQLHLKGLPGAPLLDRFELDGREVPVGDQPHLAPQGLVPAAWRLSSWAPGPLPESTGNHGLKEAGFPRKLQRAGQDLTALGRPYAMAPIRTRPRRTYDPIHHQPDPEGGHVPVLLSRVFSEGGKAAEGLRTALVDYGRASGMFDEVKVRRLGGRKDSDPFQVQVVVSGQKGERNLLDVGYGVSQVLPLLVDLAIARSRVFLLQQPEVHLHPRAQAALGTVLLGLARQKRRILVETHSDFLVDRVCMDIRDGTGGARPQDVVILFFERRDAAVHVHPIQVDRTGNLVDAPDTYREFFLDEQRRFLGG